MYVNFTEFLYLIVTLYLVVSSSQDYKVALCWTNRKKIICTSKFIKCQCVFKNYFYIKTHISLYLKNNSDQLAKCLFLG